MPHTGDNVSNFISVGALVPRIYKELSKFNNKKIDTHLKMGIRFEQIPLPPKDMCG